MATVEKTDLEGAHHPVDEKAQVLASDVSGTQSNPSDYDGELPDPDVGKSDEERARLVRPCLSSLEISILTSPRTKLLCGKWTAG